MPSANKFRHQTYPAQPRLTPRLKSLQCAEFNHGHFADLHNTLLVGRVVLVHGTFVGDDPLGVSETLKSLGQGVPLIGPQLERLASAIQENTRPATASVIQDLGNYTDAYREKFQNLVGDDPQVELLTPPWSSQNHHLARADLAVRLVHQILQNPLPDDQRTLLWGHSHAGNAFALLTNLLANDPTTVAQFFEAAGEQDNSHWKNVRQLLRGSPTPHPLAKNVFIATFGTPVRYGWDTTGYSKLVHVSFHRPYDSKAPFRTKPLFPPLLPTEVLGATWGDWVQAFAIAGTDVSSPLSKSANEKLSLLLESSLPAPKHGLDTQLIPTKRLRDTCFYWKQGTRCHTDGINLLVDYFPSGDQTSIGQSVETALLGHGVATTVKWLPTHLQLVMEAISTDGDFDNFP